MATYNLIYYPAFKATTNAGAPLAGGLLYTYGAGSSTPVATYTDSTGTIPNTNPVTLNSRGEAQVWGPSGQAYKLTLTDSAGNLIGSEDNVVLSAKGYISNALQVNEVRNSTAVLSNSLYLSGGTLTPGTYEIIVNFGFTTVVGAGFACNVNFTGGFSESGLVGWGVFGSNANAGQIISGIGTIQSTVTTPVFNLAGGTNTGQQFLLVTGSMIVTSTGTIGFAFAQSTATVGNTILTAVSYAKITQVA